ncbi:hypothetical protein AiwAL_19165 [Acidiphilium sp. AL]|uniref:hypothetical protein n=1 Tax=Acidiphilium sp. AL TaxID=2871704 RepID=UPI0021CAF2E8|nr:hypothetical protein [Acidiphilium sp. AL]MCU4162174.1 hypothetical protein [Acidiphilium sp. AL]
MVVASCEKRMRKAAWDLNIAISIADPGGGQSNSAPAIRQVCDKETAISKDYVMRTINHTATSEVVVISRDWALPRSAARSTSGVIFSPVSQQMQDIFMRLPSMACGKSITLEALAALGAETLAEVIVAHAHAHAHVLHPRPAANDGSGDRAKIWPAL